jgi:predicted RNase H-like HicB family nuclease
MQSIKYVLYREGRYYVVQCINIELSTFGESIDEALNNLDEALTLYFEDKNDVPEPNLINDIMIGEKIIEDCRENPVCLHRG